MNQDIILWLVGHTLIIGGAVLTAYIGIVQRIVRVETTLEILGEKAARVLHSPHTPELDRLLEKYLDRNYELYNAEWKELLGRCQSIEDDLANPKDQRALAAIVGAVCCHKLSKLPPKMRDHYKDE